MSLSLSLQFNQIRAVEGQKEPVILHIAVRNPSEAQKSELATVMIKIPFSLGFDKAGLMRETKRRIGFVKPGEEKSIPIPIYCKPSTREGIYPIEVIAWTHDENYSKTVSEEKQKADLRVIKP